MGNPEGMREICCSSVERKTQQVTLLSGAGVFHVWLDANTSENLQPENVMINIPNAKPFTERKIKELWTLKKNNTHGVTPTQ